MREELTFNGLDHRMDDLDVHLLDAIRSRRRNDDRVIGESFEFSAVLSEKRDGFDAVFLRGLERADDVFGISTRGKTNEHIALSSETYELAREDLVESVIIRNACDVARITESESTEWRSVFAVAAGELFREMHCITMTSAVSAREKFAAGTECFKEQLGEALALFHLFRVANEFVECRLGFGQ